MYVYIYMRVVWQYREGGNNSLRPPLSRMNQTTERLTTNSRCYELYLYL